MSEERRRPEDGGSAFPVPPDNLEGYAAIPGMTLRDWFAGLAMQGICAALMDKDAKKVFHRPDRPQEQVALLAYDLADAMLKQRGEAGDAE